MIYHLRKTFPYGKTLNIVDVDATEDDLPDLTIHIKDYSLLLLSVRPSDVASVIYDFARLQEAPEEWLHTQQGKITPTKFILQRLRILAERYELALIED